MKTRCTWVYIQTLPLNIRVNLYKVFNLFSLICQIGKINILYDCGRARSKIQVLKTLDSRVKCSAINETHRECLALDYL